MMTDRDVENTQPIRELVKEKSVTMEYFLEVSHLDNATADLLKKYDRDGNGSFSKDEVVAIILDLREAMQSNEMLGASNKMFKRMLMVAVAFCVLLLTSMFGLSYAVAALTAKINVDSNGVMTTVDGSTIVKTDSTAFTYKPLKADTGSYCLTDAERDAVLQNVLSGSNVFMEREDVNGTQKQVEQVASATVVYGEDGTVCFVDGSGSQACIRKATTECESVKSRRLESTGGTRRLDDWEEWTWDGH